jgi:hypothetical protein
MRIVMNFSINKDFKSLLLFFLLVFIGETVFPQAKKSVEALYINEPIKIDGQLDEPAYSSAKPALDFVQLQPYNGSPAYKPTQVYFLYDQSAIYVGAILYDEPDSIYNFLSERDNIGSSDYFGVYFDPYNQGQLAYGFFITPAGVQVDIKAIKTEYDNEDGSWNAVWESKTKINQNGWTVEMKIPYSALRFPENGGGTWGLNMFRNFRRHNSNTSWNFIDRQVSGFIHQQGQITGITNLKPPVRLSLSPYASAYAEFKGGESSPEFTYKGGLDLKYGISESFTLDMMLVPDFGQIQSDDKQMNLTPYELYYSEKRQFFTEGMELFDRGGIFYSRRIGANPKFAGDLDNKLNDHETIDYNPIETQLLNATKVSGRSQNGWGLGLLNAMTLSSHAIIKDTLTGDKRDELIQPFTNYNVAVIDKSLKNNSYVSLLNTNMTMADHPFYSNVTATDFQIRNKGKSLAFSGKGGISIRNNGEKETGFFGSLGFAKNSGTWQYGLSQKMVTDEFNPNDMGYLRRNNEMNTQAYLNYNIVEPFGIIKDMNISLSWDHNRMYRQNTLADNIFSLDYHNCFLNGYGIFLHFKLSGDRRDYYEPRVEGRFVQKSWYYYYGFSMFTDNSKALSAEIAAEQFRLPDNGETDLYTYLGLRYRIGRHLQLNYDLNFSDESNDLGYVDMTDSEDTIYFARRNVQTVQNILGANYALNNKAGIRLRIRHYWSGNVNKEFFRLLDDGSLINDLDYNVNKDENYNAFNIDLIFRWIFAPGSELSLAWKNSITADGDLVTRNYWKNLHQTWKSDQINSLSIKLLYYLDYNQIRKRKV